MNIIQRQTATYEVKSFKSNHQLQLFAFDREHNKVFFREINLHEIGGFYLFSD